MSKNNKENNFFEEVREESYKNFKKAMDSGKVMMPPLRSGKGMLEAYCFGRYVDEMCGKK